ncbi:aminopeptidase P family protein [Candidatus Beckwithbacteria bacterium]|nr:aminopeptidase P family protein [Candidatus Beckwithbacteria bacterium]
MSISNLEVQKRLRKFQAILKAKKLDCLLLLSAEQIFYLTNFAFQDRNGREALLLVEESSLTLLVPAMHQDQTKTVFPNITIKTLSAGMRYSQLLEPRINSKKVGVEGMVLTLAEAAVFKKMRAKLTDVNQELRMVRAIKTQTEIANITKAQDITQKALVSVLTNIKLGISEKELARKLDIAMETLGADELAFPTIVAFGKHSAVPHHKAGKTRLKNDNIVLIDMGARVGEYNGDLSRTFYFGKATDIFKKRFELVQTAQQAALKKIKAGVEIADIDQAARAVFEKAEVLDLYLHTTGHGLGIGVHEFPSLSYLQKDRLEEGMVITVEPGLYEDGWGGIRLEDVVVVAKNGYKMLGTLDQHWSLPYGG